MCDNSVDSAFKNFLRAGVLKKRSRTVIDVPSGSPASSTRAIFPPLISMMVPEMRVLATEPEGDPLKPSLRWDGDFSVSAIGSCKAAQVSNLSRDTDAIEG